MENYTKMARPMLFRVVVVIMSHNIFRLSHHLDIQIEVFIYVCFQSMHTHDNPANRIDAQIYKKKGRKRKKVETKILI